jgi:hypothetical protein
MGMGFKIKYKPESKIWIAAATQTRPRIIQVYIRKEKEEVRRENERVPLRNKHLSWQ